MPLSEDGGGGEKGEQTEEEAELQLISERAAQIQRQFRELHLDQPPQSYTPSNHNNNNFSRGDRKQGTKGSIKQYGNLF